MRRTADKGDLIIPVVITVYDGQKFQLYNQNSAGSSSVKESLTT